MVETPVEIDDIPQDEFYQYRLIIDNMKEIIKTRGWVQNAVNRPSGEVCILGAWAVAPKLVTGNPSVTRLIGHYIKRERLRDFRYRDRNLISRTHPHSAIIRWNDHPRRKEDDVLKLLHDAARYKSYCKDDLEAGA